LDRFLKWLSMWIYLNIHFRALRALREWANKVIANKISEFTSPVFSPKFSSSPVTKLYSVPFRLVFLCS
jgi:hypothetical protein